MDIDKPYKNPKLERRRQQLIRQKNAEAALRKARTKALDPRAEVIAAEAGRCIGPLSVAILRRLLTRKVKKQVAADAAFRLLRVVAERTRLLELEHYLTYLPVVFAIVRHQDRWICTPETWRPTTYNTSRQLGLLLRHLFARYPVPGFFDSAWLSNDESQQRWFLHIGQGANFRNAPQLPIPLTKLMSHHALLAPESLSVLQAIRFGQARGLGLQHRLAMQVVASRIGGVFNAAEGPFWASVLQFFARHPMLDPSQIGPIIDYLHNQKFEHGLERWIEGRLVRDEPPQPGLTMRLRDPVTLIRQMNAWHRRLFRVRRAQVELRWKSCGIPGYSRTEGCAGNERLFRIFELLSSEELRAEGQAMRHCVASYAHSCQTGCRAIYSMHVVDRDGMHRLLTIELDTPARLVVQARGRCNELPTALDIRLLRAWALGSRVRFGPGVISA